MLTGATAHRIAHCTYFRGACADLDEETLLDVAVADGGTGSAVGVDYVGGVRPQPAPFVCLLLRMQQLGIGASDDSSLAVLRAYLEQREFVYVRLLAAVHARVALRSGALVYRLLDPLYADYRRVRVRAADGTVTEEHVDEFIDRLLRAQPGEEVLDGVRVPFLASRYALEAAGELAERSSPESA